MIARCRAHEWELFREGLGSAWDCVEDGVDDPDAIDTGVEAFDRLQLGQRLALLALVGSALSDEAIPGPDLTVNTKGAVAAVYAQIAKMIELEIDMSRDPEWAADPGSPARMTHWRRLVLVAYREAYPQDQSETLADPEGDGGHDPDDSPGDHDPEENWSPPDVTSSDSEEWEIFVNDLANRILWDDGDYLEGDEYLDSDPAEARIRMKLMGIARNYFTDVAPDPADDQVEAIRRALRSLCGRPEPRGPELIDGLRDIHNDLFVGPCDADAVSNEVGCRLVEQVEVLGEHEFDCSYLEWRALLREEVHHVALIHAAGGYRGRGRRLAAADGNGGQGRGVRRSLLLDEDHWAERREGGWIVIDRKGYALLNIEDPAWSDRDDDPQMPFLEFPTPEEAMLAYLRSELIVEARSARREAAMKRLGRPSRVMRAAWPPDQSGVRMSRSPNPARPVKPRARDLATLPRHGPAPRGVGGGRPVFRIPWHRADPMAAIGWWVAGPVVAVTTFVP